MKKDNNNFLIIQKKFLTKGRNYTELFKTVCGMAEEIGFDKAFGFLEKCVIQNKILWLEQNLDKIKLTDDPLENVIKVFYEAYLGISFGKNGKIIKKTNKELITRCWNKCPVLEACNKLNLDTKKICRQAYHRYAQIFVKRIHPKLKFYRNYNHIRPYTPYCEEKIILNN
ncbi:MAG TPA: hypothetical protein PKZ16_02655 [bacterium]|nr:hypothetical protein [bacterium]HPL95395.1 hypothetical protein [bacterium]